MADNSSKKRVKRPPPPSIPTTGRRSKMPPKPDGRGPSVPPPRPSNLPKPKARPAPTKGAKPPPPPPKKAKDAAPSPKALELIEACKQEIQEETDRARAARLHFEIGQEYDTVLKDKDEALKHFKSSLKLAPEYVPSVRGARRLVLARGDYLEATALFDAELRVTSDPRQKAELHAAKGRIYEDCLDQPEDARTCYRQAAKLFPGSPAIQKALGQIERQVRSWPTLIRAYEQEANTLSSDAKHQAAVVIARARIHETRLKETKSATELYEAALTLDPYAGGALFALKRLLHNQSRWRELVEILEREAQQSADTEVQTMALFRVGRIFSDRLGDRDKAIAAFLRAAEISPLDSLVWEALVRQYELGDDPNVLTEALKRLQDTIPRPQEKLGLLHRLGQLYDDQLGDPASAQRYYESALVVDPTYIPALAALGKLYQKTGQWESLIKMHLDEAGTIGDEIRRADAYARVADISETQLNRPDEAIKHHAMALGLAPDLESSFKALTRLYKRERQYRELIELYERAVDRAGEIDVAITYLFKIGELHEEALGTPKHAVHAYQRILDRQPGHLGAIHAMQRATESAGRFRELVEALEMEAGLTTDQGRALSLLDRAGEVLEDKLDEKDAALERYRKVLKLNTKYIPVLKKLGRLYHKMGRSEDLLGIYAKELEVMPKGPAQVALLYKMGELCEKQLGNEPRAIEHYRHAIAMDPGYGPALRALSTLLGQRGDFKGLVQVLETELASLEDPKSKARVLFRIGDVLEVHLEKPNDAATAYKNAIREMPDCRPALDGLVRVSTELGQWSDLADQLKGEAETAKDPRLAIDALLRQGEIYSDYLNKPKKAIAAYEIVMEKQPDNVAALLALEPLYRTTGALKKLTNLYEVQARVFTEPSAKVAALRELVRLLEVRGLGKENDIRNACMSILSFAPRDMTALSTLERVAIEKQDTALLAEVDDKLSLATDDPGVGAVYRARYGRSIETNRSTEATAVYLEALSKDGMSLSAILGLRRLAKQAGDAKGMAEAARRHARWTKIDKAAADLLVESATIRADQLGDPKGALEDCELALERCPEHRDAAGKLTDILMETNEIDTLIDVLSRTAEAAKNKDRKGELWQYVAVLHADAKKNLPAGISVLNRMLRLEPNHVPTMEKLVTLLKRHAQWKELAKILTRILGLKPANDIVVETHLELARVLSKHLGDSGRALSSLEALLRLDQFNKEALSLLLDLRYEEGNIKAAANAAGRLLEVSKNRDERAFALLRVGQLEVYNKAWKKAANALCEAVALTGPSSQATVEYKQLLGKEEPWKNYAKALGDYLVDVQAGKVEDGDLSTTFIEIAHVQHTQLGQTDAAIATLNKGLRKFEGHVGLSFKQGEMMVEGGRYDDAIAEFQKLLHADPTRADVWRALARAFEKNGSESEVGLALSPLVVLGVAKEEEMNMVQLRSLRSDYARASSFGERPLKAISPIPDEESRISFMLNVLSEALLKLYPLDLERYRLSSRDRISNSSPTRFLSDQLAKVFGVEQPDIYMHHVATPTVAIELGQPVPVLVSASVADLPKPKQVFVLARLFANMARGLHPVTKLGARQLEFLLKASTYKADKGGSGWRFDEDELKKQNKILIKATSRRGRRAVEEAAKDYANGSDIDIEKCVQSIQLTSTRAAAVLSGDLPGCVNILRAEDHTLSSLTGKDLIERSPLIRDLLRFWVSKPSIDLRTQAGML